LLQGGPEVPAELWRGTTLLNHNRASLSQDVCSSPSVFGRTMTTSILGRARKRHAYIVFVDEAGFMLASLLRRTWAPRGCTPVVRISEPHERISVIGAITISPERRHFCFYFQLSADNTNFRGESMVQFIEYVRRRVPGPITLLWDQILFHRAKPVPDYLATHRSVVVEPFPPYAPELNPVDNVWSYVKYNRLPNYTPPYLCCVNE